MWQDVRYLLQVLAQTQELRYVGASFDDHRPLLHKTQDLNSSDVFSILTLVP